MVCSIFGTWDDKLTMNKLIMKIKSMFGVDFSNCQKHGFVATLANCALRQMRKTIVNSMHVTHGMIL